VLDALAAGFAGALAVNSVPHLVNGLSGRSFRTPFVRLTGSKLSGPMLNVAWGWANAVAAALILQNLTTVSPPAVAIGALVAGLALAAIFSRDA